MELNRFFLTSSVGFRNNVPEEFFSVDSLVEILISSNVKSLFWLGFRIKMGEE